MVVVWKIIRDMILEWLPVGSFELSHRLGWDLSGSGRDGRDDW